MKIYRVGGAVRDKLLGLKITEQDYVVVGASPEMMIQKGFKPVGKDFPVFLHPITHEEYALARTERKNGFGYKGFKCYSTPYITLEEDLKRRDLTINAFAETLEGDIIDPYHGLNDLEHKILRHVSSAFIEDPVRILRVARFMARFSVLGFKVAKSTLALMETMVLNGEVNALVPERIWREFSKALQEPNPEEFIMTLYHCKALTRICPELNQLFNIPHQGSNLGLISIQALKNAVASTPPISNNPVIRFATLMQYLSPEQAQAIAKRWILPRTYQDLMMLSVQFREKMHTIEEITAIKLMQLLEQLDAFRRSERFKQFLQVCTFGWYAQSLNRIQEKDSTLIIAQKLLSAYKIAQSISMTSIQKLQSNNHLDGRLLGLQLKEARIQAIEQQLIAMNTAKDDNIVAV